MPFIYYIVSVVNMEILRFFLSFLLKEYGGGDFSQLFEKLQAGNFDLKSILDLNIESLAPLIKSFFGGTKNPSETSDGLSQIADIADRDIVYALNRYFAEPASEL